MLVKDDICTIIGALDVSQSLLDTKYAIENSTTRLKDGDEEEKIHNKKSPIIKACVDINGSNKAIAYFLDTENTLGIGSVIRMKCDLNEPLLYRNHYDIIKSERFEPDIQLIEMLLNKKI